MAEDELVDISITGPDEEKLAEFTRKLVDSRLAACGNIIPSIRSIYRWEGEVRDEREALVVLHTRQSLVKAIIDFADKEHPYDTPQVLAVPVTDVHPGYKQWVLDSTRQTTKRPLPQGEGFAATPPAKRPPKDPR
ncbi:divalent-cation tolerance protein CutA [Nocardia aurantiaca]|uniref:Divalent cation tolerance protein CutA n=1 Tax=Nocardia aurantiaca TaxID=2675850 RepID=A0A6I3L1P4_9NOCA|nr:divalent-cation tolerance protein CutA [Nocardia aurantiaca]MTE14524.1 divalent cation tolerance protein CutA [Nocardia aurantiaca]